MIFELTVISSSCKLLNVQLQFFKINFMNTNIGLVLLFITGLLTMSQSIDT